MKTDKVVSFDKLWFTIFILGYKSGTGLNDKSTPINHSFYARKKRVA
jgi:hypothetical protein